LTRKLQEWDAKVRQTDQNNERKIAEYENKIRVMSQEIDRLNEVLRTKNIELEQSRRQFKEYQDSVTMEVKGNYSQYETTVSNLNKEIEDLKRKLNENSIKTKEY
jgi:chromosome segregation ATPase